MVEAIVKKSKTEGVEGSSKTTVSSSTGTYRIRILLGTLFALVVADGLISNFLVAQGLGRELNPFLQTLVGQEDFSLLLLKVAGALLSVFILWRTYGKRPQISATMALLLVIVYTGILYWNIFAFLITQAQTFFPTM